jgi:hypothetical protein
VFLGFEIVDFYVYQCGVGFWCLLTGLISFKVKVKIDSSTLVGATGFKFVYECPLCAR